jgi:hypothetical protein
LPVTRPVPWQQGLQARSQLNFSQLDYSAELDRLLPAERQAQHAAVLDTIMSSQPQPPEGYSLLSPDVALPQGRFVTPNPAILTALAELGGALLVNETTGQVSLYLRGTRSGNTDDLADNFALLTRSPAFAERTLASYRDLVDELAMQEVHISDVVGLSKGGATAQLLPAPIVYTYAAPTVPPAPDSVYHAYGFSQTRPTVAVHLFDRRDPIATYGGTDLTLGGLPDTGETITHIQGSEDGGVFPLNRGGTIYGLNNVSESHFKLLRTLATDRQTQPNGTVGLPLEALYERNARNTLSFNANSGLMTDNHRRQFWQRHPESALLTGVEFRF